MSTSRWSTIKKHLIAYWANITDALSVVLRFSSRKLRNIVRPIQRMFGFSVIREASSQKIIDLSSFLTETDTKITELPKPYRELYKFDPVIDEALYVNTSDNVMNLRKTYEAWQEGVATNVALVGEKGSGKSTLIQIFKSHLPEDEEIVEINIEYSTWRVEQLLGSLGSSFGLKDINRPETLIRGINDQQKRQVVILEGLQNMYLRNINGFDALEALWLIISETKEKVFWMVSCSRYAWDFLNKAYAIETHFTHTFQTDHISEEQLEEVIMKRHEKSEYRLEFEPDEQTRRSRAFKKRLHKPKELQNYLKQEYFERLCDISDGNISVAIILWLRSIKKVEDKTITIAPFTSVDIEMMDFVNAEVLFVLAAIVMHDSLKVAELSRILNISLGESKVFLSKLRSRGILIEKEGLFWVNQLVFRQVVRLLRKRNVIH